MTSALLAPPPQFDRWWTCPPWCGGDCTGGDVFDLGSATPFPTLRAHERVLFRSRAADVDLRHTDVNVTFAVERADAEDDPGETDIVLRVGAGGARLSRQQRHELAAALLAVDEIVPEGV